MKPSAFEYRRPVTLADAVAELHEFGDGAKVIAGGQSLVPLMNFRLVAPEILVDLNGVVELGQAARFDGTLRLGGLTRHRELETREDVARLAPLLRQAAPYIGHPQIRSRGTLGGSLAHADPSAELPAVTLALDGVVIARSVRGERRIPAADFFQFHFTTALENDEIVVAVEYPVATERQGSAFTEVAARFGDFAWAGAAAIVRLDQDHCVTHARIACASVGLTPLRVPAAEERLIGEHVKNLPLDDVQAAVVESLDPSESLKASAGYKRRCAATLARRAVIQAATAAADGRES